MNRKTFGDILILFGIVGLIFSLFFYLNQVLLDPKEASTVNKNLAIVSAVAGVIGITAGLVARRKGR